MVELELLGLHGDGEHLTLTDAEGRRYRLPIDDELRAAVRRDRPRLEALQAAGRSALRPKEIQSLLRAGASVAEVAERSGLPQENVRRYEGPVTAERTWVVQRAQAQRLGHDDDSPQLGDLVVDRLAARGVAADSLQWDAVRRPGESWEVLVTFVAGEKEREARWEVDLAAKALHALDDESRWLSETEVGAPARRRHLNPVLQGRGPAGPAAPVTAPSPAGGVSTVSAVSAPSAAPAVEDDGAEHPTESLLAQLRAHRGTRSEVRAGTPDEDGDDAWDGPGAHPPMSQPQEATDAHVLSLPRRTATSEAEEPDGPGTTPALPAEEAAPADEAEPGSARARRGRRNGRRSVPSWDEIVFGARPE